MVLSMIAQSFKYGVIESSRAWEEIIIPSMKNLRPKSHPAGLQRGLGIAGSLFLMTSHCAASGFLSEGQDRKG